MEKMTVKSNSQARHTLDWHDLTALEQAEFDYIDSEQSRVDATFVRYRGVTYDLGEFSTTHGMPEFSPLTKWDGYHSNSYFSGIVVRHQHGLESVIVGSFYS